MGRFERLYAEHAGRVFGLCLRMTGDRMRATELAQDVFVDVWRNLDRLREDDRDTGGWVWPVARVRGRDIWGLAESRLDAAALPAPMVEAGAAILSTPAAP